MKIDGLGSYSVQNSIDTAKSAAQDNDFEAALKKAYDEGDKKKLKEACDEFEGVMLKMLYKQMKATIPKGGFLEESNAQGIFQEMLDDKLMDEASTRSVGVSGMLYKQLSEKMDRTWKVNQSGEDEATQEKEDSIEK